MHRLPLAERQPRHPSSTVNERPRIYRRNTTLPTPERHGVQSRPCNHADLPTQWVGWSSTVRYGRMANGRDDVRPVGTSDEFPERTPRAHQCTSHIVGYCNGRLALLSYGTHMNNTHSVQHWDTCSLVLPAPKPMATKPQNTEQPCGTQTATSSSCRSTAAQRHYAD
jgi:hypothetical protein